MSTVVPHVDISEVVREHFTNTGNLPASVYLMDAGELEELIDAFSPETDRELIDALSILLENVRMEGGCFS